MEIAEIFLFLYLPIVLIRILRILIGYLPVAFYRRKINTETNESVSVVIAAHNEAHNLPNLLQSLQNQDYSDFEVILVDDRSTDRTPQIIAEYCESNPKASMIKIEEVEKGVSPKKNALEKGVLAAKGEIIITTDADCRPVSKDWIRSMAAAFEDSTEIVLGISPIAGKGVFGVVQWYDSFITAIKYVGAAINKRPYMGVGRNLAYKKSLFVENEGFKSHQHVLSGDDDLFIQQAANKRNTTVNMASNAQTVSIDPKNLGSFVRQKIRHLGAGKSYRFSSKLTLGLDQLTLLFFYALSIFFMCHETFLAAALSCYLLRTTLLFVTFVAIARRLTHTSWLGLVTLPVTELIHTLLLTSISFLALFSTKLRWK